MSIAYYNENDLKAAEWLCELIKQGHIAPGVVDTRSIEDVRPTELVGFSQCHFFAGIGGWSYALRLAGWPDDKPIWTGSCPCQPFSSAGAGAGFDDKRHLWPVFHRLIDECRPSTVFGEQVASAAALEWWDVVSADLENSDYAVGAADLCAASVFAPHIRQRLYWVAHTNGAGLEGSAGTGLQRSFDGFTRDSANDVWRNAEWRNCTDGKTRPIEPSTEPLAHGIPARVVRLRGYGNSIVPQLAAEFVKASTE